MRALDGEITHGEVATAAGLGLDFVADLARCPVEDQARLWAMLTEGATAGVQLEADIYQDMQAKGELESLPKLEVPTSGGVKLR